MLLLATKKAKVQFKIKLKGKQVQLSKTQSEASKCTFY